MPDEAFTATETVCRRWRSWAMPDVVRCEKTKTTPWKRRKKATPSLQSLFHHGPRTTLIEMKTIEVRSGESRAHSLKLLRSLQSQLYRSSRPIRNVLSARFLKFSRM